LVIRRGPTLAALRQLISETGADSVYWTRLYEPAVIERDRTLKEALREQGVEARSFKAGVLLEPFELQTGLGSPYRVFTPFWRSAAERLNTGPPLAAPQALPPHRFRGLALEALELKPRLTWDAGFVPAWTPGEAGASEKLERFCATAAASYKQRRDLPAEAGTSALSPHLHFGEISPAQVLHRVRMIVASYLTKNLLIPWQEGARWFWDTLVDADLASNTLGWQWAAGCGADAAPYFRIFNPVLQAGKFDAAGAYVRRWVPELSGLPDGSLLAPWQAASEVLTRAGLRLGTDYPAPRVDLAGSRDRALAAYATIKASTPDPARRGDTQRT
jgi:deoxyribodipyrimidine photolyase